MWQALFRTVRPVVAHDIENIDSVLRWEFARLGKAYLIVGDFFDGHIGVRRQGRERSCFRFDRCEHAVLGCGVLRVIHTDFVKTGRRCWVFVLEDGPSAIAHGGLATAAVTCHNLNIVVFLFFFFTAGADTIHGVLLLVIQVDIVLWLILREYLTVAFQCPPYPTLTREERDAYGTGGLSKRDCVECVDAAAVAWRLQIADLLVVGYG